MRHGFDRGVVGGIGLFAAMIVGITATSYVNTRDLRDDAGRAARSREVLEAVGAVRADARGLQAAQRAYLVSGLGDWLEPYEGAAATLRADAAALAALTAGDPDQHPRAEAAARAIETGIARLNEVVAVRRTQGHEAVAALARERGPRSFVDPLLETLAEMDRAERGRLAARDAATAAAYDRAVLYGLAAAVLGLAALGMFVWLLARSVRARDRDAARLDDQRELLDATLTSIGDGVIVADAAGRVTFLNAVAERLTGWAAGQAGGAALETVFRIVSETTRAPVENPAARALREGRIVGLANHTVLIARDGTEWPLDDSAAPIRDRTGAVAGAVLVFREIGGRKAAEAALAAVTAASERQKRVYETILSATPDLVYVFDLEHRFTYANAALLAMWGTTWAEAAGKTCLELGYEPWHAAMHDREIDQVRATGRPIRGEVPFTGTAGRRVYDYIFVPVLGPDGAVEAVAGTTRDVTDRKAAEERLRLLDALGEAVRAAADPAAVMAATTRLLGGHLGATRCAYADVEPDNDRFTVRHDWTAGGHPSSVGVYSLDLFGTRAAAAMRAGRTLVVRDVDRELAPADGAAAFNAIGVKAAVCSPLVKDGRLVAMMAVHQAAPRDWTAAEVAAVEEVVERSWAHIERVRAAAVLRESEERLRFALDGAELGSWNIDPATNTLTTDERFQVVFAGAAGPLDYEQAFALVHPDDRDRVRAALAAATRPDDPAPYAVEYRVVHRDGAVRWVAARGRARFAGAGADRRLVSFDGTVADVTDRKLAEAVVRFLADASATLAELVDYESTLGRIANLSLGGFADWCVVDVVDAAGARRRLGFARAADAAARAGVDTAVGVPHVLRTGEPELVPDVDALDPAAAPQGARLERLKGWGVRSYLCVPLLSRGRVTGGMTFLSTSVGRRYGPEELRVAQDLAGRVATAIENATLYRALQEQDRRKDEFLATLAHELRNPLAPVRNGLQILRVGDRVGPGADRTLDMMDRQVGLMVHLVDDLMDVARVSSGKVVLRKERLDVRAVVGGAVETCRQAVDAAGHALDVRLPDDPLPVDADRTRLTQVLANLLNNAAKYTPPGGRVVLSAERAGADVVVRVADTGVGIPAEMLPRIFDMFTQVGASLDRSQGGLGIGLTLVRRLVEMHGGTVTAHSGGAGAGSEFVVRLPAPAGAARAAEAPPAAGPGPAEARLKVLVVDDNRDAADSLAMLLEMKGHEVRTAHDGPEALRVLEAYRPDLILLDLGLPGMNGYEVARRVRESPGLRGVTLAALTGWGQEEDRRRTKAAGFDHHLVKPADPADIEHILAGVVVGR